MCGDRVQLLTLLERIYSPHVRAHVPVMQSLMRLVPFLSFGDEEKINALIEHFKQFVDFEKSVSILEILFSYIDLTLSHAGCYLI